MMSAIGKTPGPLGTDHSPMFTRFSSPIATPSDGLLPTIFSPPPATPSRWGLDAVGAQTYHDLLLQWPHDELLSELSTGRNTFVQARADLYQLAQAASVLELNHTHDGQQIHEAAERATRSLRYTREYTMEKKQLILTHIQPQDQPIFDAKACIKRYESASKTWHASLASGLRIAYGKAKTTERAKPPLPSQATGPERIRPAMRVCHHWHKLNQSQWGGSAPTSSGSVLLRRLRHVHDGALLWGTSTSPPPVGLSWAADDYTAWTEWALAAIPAINRFLISSGVAHTHGTFCTHPTGNETRLQVV